MSTPATRRSSRGRSPGRAGRERGADLEQPHVGARGWPSWPRPAGPARAAAAAGARRRRPRADSAGARCPSPSAVPSGSAADLVEPLRRPVPARTARTAASIGASGRLPSRNGRRSDGKVLVAVQPGDLLDQVDLARRRSGPPARHVHRDPAVVRLANHGRADRDQVASPARAQGSSTPSTWATRAGRRKMRGGCDGSGQRSSGASASLPPAVARMSSMQRRIASAPPQRSMPRSKR